MSVRLSTGFVDAVNQTGSVKTIMQNGVIYGYSGIQPDDADLIETGTLLIIFTVNGNAFTPGVSTNGLNMGTSTGGVLSKAAGENWMGTGIANGVLGYFRWYANARVQGNSTSAVRADGAVGSTSFYEMEGITGKTIVSGIPATLSVFNFIYPKTQLYQTYEVTNGSNVGMDRCRCGRGIKDNV